MNQIKNNRNYGIDALRLYAMFLVVVLHVLGQGGVIALASKDSAKYAVAWFFEVAAYCAVNCFALVSGYVTYKEEEKPYRYERYIPMWLQVFFYSVGLTVLCYLWNPAAVNRNDLMASFFPVTKNRYWYFSAYTGVFFIIPWLNLFVRRCSEKELTRCMTGLFLVFSCYGTISGLYSDPFHLGGGYTFVWLSLMYLAGAWMKKCSIPEKVKGTKAGLLLVACLMFTWAAKVFLPIRTPLVSYVSPTIILISLCYVILFSKWKPGNIGRYLIGFFSPAAFGVYLIHVQSVVWREIMKGRFAAIADKEAWMMPFYILGSAAFVFLLCLLIEKGRILLFRILHVDELVAKGAEVVKKTVRRQA